MSRRAPRPGATASPAAAWPGTAERSISCFQVKPFSGLLRKSAEFCSASGVIGVLQLRRMPGGKQPHAFRVLPQDNAAAFPLGKVQQCVKIFASEQNGTADRERRAILRCAQPEVSVLPLCRKRKRIRLRCCAAAAADHPARTDSRKAPAARAAGRTDRAARCRCGGAGRAAARERPEQCTACAPPPSALRPDAARCRRAASARTASARRRSPQQHFGEPPREPEPASVPRRLLHFSSAKYCTKALFVRAPHSSQ